MTHLARVSVGATLTADTNDSAMTALAIRDRGAGLIATGVEICILTDLDPTVRSDGVPGVSAESRSGAMAPLEMDPAYGQRDLDVAWPGGGKKLVPMIAPLDEMDSGRA
jgi:hypothetical protein